MKKKIFLKLICVALSLTGCEGALPDVPEDTAFFESSPVGEQVTEDPVIDTADPVTDAADPVTDEEGPVEDTPPPGYDYGSLDAFFKAEDPGFAASDAYPAAEKAFEGIMDDIYKIAEDPVLDPRFDLAYIDGDDIPELLVCYGNYHVSGVCIYRYDPALDEVISYGEYGTSGNLMYFVKRGFIEYQLGNQGYFRFNLVRIPGDGSGAELKEAWVVDGTGRFSDDFLIYHDDTVYTDPSNVFEGPEYDVISDEELDVLIEACVGPGAESGGVEYDYMKSIFFE